MKNVRKYGILLCIIVSFLTLACQQSKKKEILPASQSIDLSFIRQRDTLIVLTMNSAISYYEYRGEPMGFQYELARQFADSLGVKLKIQIAPNVPDMVQMLSENKGDLIAYPVPLKKEYKEDVIYCGEEVITHQVVVQRKQQGKKPLKNVTELIGKEVYAQQGRHLDRLINLDKELGGGILIREADSDSLSIEDLLRQVSEGKIDYAVCDNDVAKLNKTYYPNLNIHLSISFDQRASWAVRKSSPELAKAANRWQSTHATSARYKASSRRYFRQRKRISHGSILSLKDGKISHFDDLFKKYAKEIGWDWRMVASLAYTESNFDTAAVSWAGARGLMQLMPNTAHRLGVPDGKENNAEESIKAATRYLKKLSQTFYKIKDPEEQKKFVLASYNAGVGHVIDAMNLAQKYDKERYVWEGNVDKFILLKSKEEYYNDPVCDHGYFRGWETYNFVREILARTKIYQEKIP